MRKLHLTKRLSPGRSISRILSRGGYGRGHGSRVDDHLSRQPTRTFGLAPRVRAVPARKIGPAWPCSRWGLPGCRIAADTGGLLHHHFTLANRLAVCFCGPSRRLPRAGVSPASRPVECGLSSMPKGTAITQPAWVLLMIPQVRLGGNARFSFTFLEIHGQIGLMPPGSKYHKHNPLSFSGGVWDHLPQVKI